MNDLIGFGDEDDEDRKAPAYSARDFHEHMTNATMTLHRTSPGFYCSIIRNMEKGCLQRNLLDLWKYDPARIANLTKKDIVHAVNTISIR